MTIDQILSLDVRIRDHLAKQGKLRKEDVERALQSLPQAYPKNPKAEPILSVHKQPALGGSDGPPESKAST